MRDQGTVSADDHDLLIEIKTMLGVALEQIRTTTTQVSGLMDRVGRLESRVGATETAAAERSRLPNWVPTAAMVCSIVMAAAAIAWRT